MTKTSESMWKSTGDWNEVWKPRNKGEMRKNARKNQINKEKSDWILTKNNNWISGQTIKQSIKLIVKRNPWESQEKKKKKKQKKKAWKRKAGSKFHVEFPFLIPGLESWFHFPSYSINGLSLNGPIVLIFCQKMYTSFSVSYQKWNRDSRPFLRVKSRKWRWKNEGKTVIWSRFFNGLSDRTQTLNGTLALFLEIRLWVSYDLEHSERKKSWKREMNGNGSHELREVDLSHLNRVFRSLFIVKKVDVAHTPLPLWLLTP